MAPLSTAFHLQLIEAMTSAPVIEAHIAQTLEFVGAELGELRSAAVCLQEVDVEVLQALQTFCATRQPPFYVYASRAADMELSRATTPGTCRSICCIVTAVPAVQLQDVIVAAGKHNDRIRRFPRVLLPFGVVIVSVHVFHDPSSVAPRIQATNAKNITAAEAAIVFTCRADIAAGNVVVAAGDWNGRLAPSDANSNPLTGVTIARGSPAVPTQYGKKAAVDGIALYASATAGQALCRRADDPEAFLSTEHTADSKYTVSKRAALETVACSHAGREPAPRAPPVREPWVDAVWRGAPFASLSAATAAGDADAIHRMPAVSNEDYAAGAKATGKHPLTTAISSYHLYVSFDQLVAVVNALLNGPSHVDPDVPGAQGTAAEGGALGLVMFHISDCMLDATGHAAFDAVAKLLLKANANPGPARDIARQRYGENFVGGGGWARAAKRVFAAAEHIDIPYELAARDSVRVCCVSDTHGDEGRLLASDLGDPAVLVHAGDFTL